MEHTDIQDVDAQLRDKVWTFAQRGVVLLVAAGIGLLFGYQLWGNAGKLAQQVAQLEEKVNLREKERDTLRNQMAIVDRGKKEVEKRLEDLTARCSTQAGTEPAP